jgi:hypothetical protein
LVDVVDSKEGWLQYRCDDPNEANPIVLEELIKHKIRVVSLREMPRSLETVYLQAVTGEDKKNA